MLFKHITLLMFSGVIIPVYLQPCCLKTDRMITPAKTVMIGKSIKPDKAFHFSFINDVAVKLLPAINFFK